LSASHGRRRASQLLGLIEGQALKLSDIVDDDPGAPGREAP